MEENKQPIKVRDYMTEQERETFYDLRNQLTYAESVSEGKRIKKKIDDLIVSVRQRYYQELANTEISHSEDAQTVEEKNMKC